MTHWCEWHSWKMLYYVPTTMELLFSILVIHHPGHNGKMQHWLNSVKVIWTYWKLFVQRDKNQCGSSMSILENFCVKREKKHSTRTQSAYELEYQYPLNCNFRTLISKVLLVIYLIYEKLDLAKPLSYYEQYQTYWISGTLIL